MKRVNAYFSVYNPRAEDIKAHLTSLGCTYSRGVKTNYASDGCNDYVIAEHYVYFVEGFPSGNSFHNFMVENNYLENPR